MCMKTKGIIFKLELEGEGIVNFDTVKQKWILNQYKGTKHLVENLGNDNMSYAKKNFYKDGDDVSYKIKISSDCLRNDMFKNDVLAQTPSISHNPVLLHSYLASPSTLLRGYVFTDKSKDSIKRKSPITITDAEQTSNNLTVMDVHTTTTEKITKEDKDDKSGLSLFSKESIGKVSYESKGSINLNQLQFMGCDAVFDRYSMNPDNYSLFERFINQRIKNYGGLLGYYKLKTSVNDIPELGVLFSESDIEFMTKEALKRILSIHIKRATAYAKTKVLKIKLVKDSIDDNFNTDDGWITLKTEADIDNLSLGQIELFYEAVDTIEAKAVRTQILEEIKRVKKEEKDAKDTKDAKSKKDKKTNDTEEDND
jgi:hypothetical protein